MHAGRRITLTLLCLGLALDVGAADVPYDSDLFGGMRARAIGPATMSGRIASIDASQSDPLQIFVGTASGGVWRSIDGGISFKAVFEDRKSVV